MSRACTTDGSSIDHVEVAGDITPRPLDGRIQIQVAHRRADSRVVGMIHQRRDAQTAVADDLGGHALAHLAARLRPGQHGEIRMRVDVDEARTHDGTGGVAHLGRRRVE
jgi:hypothetical protein